MKQPKTSHSKIFREFVDKELLYCPEIPEEYAKTIGTHYTGRLSDMFDYMEYLWRQISDEEPCEVNTDDKFNTEELLTFLKKEGKLINRRFFSYETKGCNYIFEYEKNLVWVSIAIRNPEKQSSDKMGSIFEPAEISISHGLSTPCILSKFDSFIYVEPEPEETPSSVGIIKQNNRGLYIHNLDLEDNGKVFSLDNYNEDFNHYYEDLKVRLAAKKPGLYLMHGDPGTGKSSTIRQLIKDVEREFIFVPPQFVSNLSQPEFADILTEGHRGCVLVVEDAEKALMKRESQDGFHNSTLVSCVLNLTDGLYADLTNVAILATYNCDKSLIDDALLRKGRLKSEYKFDKLSLQRTRALIEKLGQNREVTEPMTLADIFNWEGDQYTNNEDRDKPKNIGFGAFHG